MFKITNENDLDTLSKLQNQLLHIVLPYVKTLSSIKITTITCQNACNKHIE